SAAETATELERIATLLEKRASHADVAAFVERVVGDVFVARERELVHALRSFDPNDPAVQAEARKEAQLPPTAVPAAIPIDVAPAAPLAETRADASILGEAQEPPPFGGDSPGPVDATLPTDDVLPSTPRPTEASTAKAAAAARAIVESTPLRRDDDAAPAPSRRPMSPWVRLVLLVVIGIVVGIGVIALIEAVRGPAETASTATGTPTQKPTATQAAQPTITATTPPAPPPTQTATAEPVPTETATASATTQPTAEPTPPPPPVKTGPAPPVKTGTVKPPPTAKPPGTGTVKKPPVKKHNPTGI
ncbi:MAG: hypothetical protein JNK04_06395, partial [Myxococcales bacterium]|nr:hypothetical protein [Myxococcales bacterium]